MILERFVFAQQLWKKSFETTTTYEIKGQLLIQVQVADKSPKQQNNPKPEFFFLLENTYYIISFLTFPPLEIYLYFPTLYKKIWTRSSMACVWFFNLFTKPKIQQCSFLVSGIVVNLDS